MKIFSTLLYFLCFHLILNAQNFNGQWKGGFTDNSSGYVGFTGDKIDYVLELDCDGSSVTGYSYTYFMGNSKRYYTICKLKGTINKVTKEIIVTEFERTKYNTPPDFRNCFQTHKLKYLKDSDDVETLEGSWFPAPNQSEGCGFGKTTLTRRLMKIFPVPNPPKPIVSANRKNPGIFPTKITKNILPQKPQAKVLAEDKKQTVTTKPALPKNNSSPDITTKKNIPAMVPMARANEPVNSSPLSFEKRSKSLLKTIEIKEDSFHVQLYDNGEIDGDSVSVFYNGSLLVSHKRLSDKPISLSLGINKSLDVNELTMYAENLGTIPPNTALMIVTDGSRRYEVRITSDTEKNGTIAFVHKNR